MTLPVKSALNKDSDNEQKTESTDDSDEKRGSTDSGQEQEVKKEDGETTDQDPVCIIIINLINLP